MSKGRQSPEEYYEDNSEGTKILSSSEKFSKDNKTE